MKRLFLFIISIMLIGLSLPLSASAEENYDSVTVQLSEKELVQESPNDTVIKLFHGMFIGQFGEMEDIKTIISNKSDYYEIYLVKSGMQICYKHSYNGEISRIAFSTTHLTA